MKTFAFTYIILFFICSTSFAMDFQIEKNLHWKDSANTPLELVGAVYSHSTGSIPLVSGIIELSYYPNPEFIINTIQQSKIKSNVLTNVMTILKTNNVQFDFVVEKSGSTYLLKYSFPAIQKSANGELSKIDKISFTISVKPTNRLKSGLTPISVIENSALSKGKWYKFEVIKNGIYKISKKDLSDLGIPVSKSVRVFTFPKNTSINYNKATLLNDLYECPVLYNDGGDGVFNNNDYVVFYGESADTWFYDSKNNFIDHKNNSYSISNYYYLLIDDGEPLKISTISSNITANYVTNSFDNVDYHENDESNMFHSGREWFESMPVSGMKFSISNNVNSDIRFKVRTVTNSSIGLNYVLTNNSSAFQTIQVPQDILFTDGSWSSKITYFTQKASTTSLKIGIEDGMGSSTSKSMLDYIILNYRSKLSFDSKQLLFRDMLSIGKQSKYTITTSELKQVWNVTDAANPKQMQLMDENGTKSFVFASDTLETFVAFNETKCYTPTFVETVKNQNLHALKDIDMLIITADAFSSQAQELKDLHYRLDGLQTAIVDQKSIFNEFSGGRPCPEGIRDFARYIYDKGNNRLSFILLLGDGSYDNRNFNSNTRVITYQTQNTIGDRSMVTDDFYGLLDVGEGINFNDNIIGALDVAIGRVPINTIDEANDFVKKVTDYCSTSKTRGDWRNRLTFVADDANGGPSERIHMEQANELADKCTLLNPNLIANKIFLDAYPKVAIAGGSRYPTVNKVIESTIKNGCLLFNYTGHGNPLRMAEEIVVDKSEVEKWQNPNTLPLFIAAACQVARFDDESRRSLGEDILLSNHGGGIAIIASARSVYADANKELNANVFDYLFNLTPEGKPQYLGQVLKNAKNKFTSDNANKYNFLLLGDPAVRLSMPVYNVVTDKVNGISVGSSIDTLKALSKVTISGHIEDLQGKTLETYSGFIQTVVFDKPQNITTLNNDGAGPVQFTVQNNTLFKGKATVQNGQFSFSFIVPKDIYYYYGNGRISYYVDNGITDGSGSFQKFIVGGSSNTSIGNSGGPKIQVCMNDTNFVNGGITNASPTLIVSTKDELGINVSGTSVGHDATAIFDANKSEQIVINQFYESAVNTYQKGSFRYPVSALNQGKHDVSVKVWNINNEASEKNLEFIVEESASIALLHVLNYPNPFTTNTNFYFEHNQSNQMIDVLIQIFTVSGKLIKTISSSYFAEGNRSFPINWDGKDDYGDNIGRGVYIYKVRLRNSKQQVAQKIEKLVILK